MAAGTSAPAEAGQGPSLMSIAANIGGKIRDAAESAKEEREKAAAKGESPKKGSLFKSSLANQFNPVKSKKAKSQWAKQFDWNKKSDATEKVKAPPSGGGGDGGKAKLKEFIAGGFTAILQDTGMMVSKLDTVKAISGENLSEATKSSGTLTVIKETLDAQTELRRKALEEAKFARAEKKLEKREDVAGVNDTKPVEKEKGEGEGEGEGGGGGPFDWLLGGLDLLDTGLGIKSLLGGGQAAAGGGAGLGAGAIAAIVGGAGLASSGLGEGFFQLTKKGGLGEQTRDFFKNKGDEVGGPMGMMLGGIGNVAGFSNEATKATGTALDVIGAPFRYAIEALRNPFLSEEDKIKQAENLAKFDARVRENFRSGFNAIDFMNIVSDEKGAFGNIYGNQGAQADMMNKMSEGGMVKLAGGAGIVDDPMRTTLYPGDSVIPLNRNVGKQMFGDTAGENLGELPITAASAMMLGVASGMLGKTESGTAGDAVKQKIRQASKEFGISNLTFTSDIGKGTFAKMNPEKTSKDFFALMLDNFKMFGGGSDGGGAGDDGGGGGGGGSPGADLSGTAVQDEVNLAQGGTPTVGFTPNQGYLARGGRHRGVDIGTSQQKGYFVGMKKTGKVVHKDYDDVSGNWVGIDVGNNTEYRFMHLAAPSPLNVGDTYDGQTIGEIGNTGRSFGEHLHFEKLVNGSHVDPTEDAKALLDIGKGLNRDYDPVAARQPVQVTPTAQDPGTTQQNGPATPGPTRVTREAESGGSFNLLNPMSWFSGRAQSAISGKDNAKYNTNTLAGKLAERRRMQEEAMRQMRGYQGGGTGRTRPGEYQRRARVAAQSESMKALNSGGGVDIKGGTFGTTIGKGYPAVYKGREAIKVKLAPGGTWEPEITYGGKRWFGVKQGDSVIYVSHFKAGQKNLGVQTKETRPAAPPRPTPPRNPAPASRPAPAAPSTTAVVAPPTQSVGAKTAAAMGSFGDNVPAGKTSAMVFADFLYPDLV
jgi:murein DD-endopeptidase MepM/ murein hydrolase activator NlpD